jgi:hypothetical protein
VLFRSAETAVRRRLMLEFEAAAKAINTER